MSGRIPTRGAFLAILVLAALLPATAFAAAPTEVIYNSIPTPLPGNVPSLGFAATSTSEFGGAVQLAAPSQTTTKVSITMSSWACQSGGAEDGSCVSEMGSKFEWPLSLHIYALGVGGTIGTQVASLTKTFKLPYRPSASSKCSNGGWYRMGSCFHGKLFKVSFALKGVTIPTQSIVALAYNTSNYGAHPAAPQPCNTSNNCPYDSLNVGLTGSPTVGTAPLPEDAFLSSTWGGAYCDNGVTGTGSFRLDAGCWGGYQPQIEIVTG
ncbi:MAG TPA: hypothetical protein VGN13_13430 [Solirubrobacteraceae bacterium]|jgi:hypothetical protein